MRICGIICEYNPFHNGHAQHLRAARKRARADALVCVMSGAFTQRGEPALLDKWLRARMALEGGADVIIELPTSFATAQADRFAWGGVYLLDSLGADALAFGSELADMQALRAMAALHEREDDELRAQIRAGLAQGQSVARARGQAVAARLGLPAHAADAPNTALAIGYLRALARLNSPMAPVAIPRSHSYHSTRMHPLASASAIRASVLGGDVPKASQAMPPHAYRALLDALPGGIPAPRLYDTLLLHALRAMTPEDIARYPLISEGLEHRVHAAARHAADADALVARIKTKRYPRARITRLLTHILLGLKDAHMRAHPSPTYARVLGFRRQSAGVLTHLSARTRIPLVTDVPAFAGQQNADFAADLRATDTWGLLTGDDALRTCGRDFTHPIEIRSP